MEADDALRTARAAKALARLRGEPGGLWAVLDASRDARVLPVLGETHLATRSLYDGARGGELADVAPHLLELPPDEDLLRLIVEESWGDSWGVFLRCDGVDLRELRRHLRRFLRVRDEAGKTLLFRWYDPRVLRAFLPACTAAEAAQFFGPVEAFMVEGWEGESFLRIERAADGEVRVHTEAL